MKAKIISFSTLLVFMVCNIAFSQIENVPLSNPVYNFLKEMRVKGIISNYHDDDPNLSRFEVADMLKVMKSKNGELSTTEKKLLKKYEIEFVPEMINKNTTMSLFGGNMKTSNGFKDFFSDKEKYLFSYQKNNNNVFINGLGHLYYVNELKPNKKSNSKLFDVGFRIRGSLFNHLGYYFEVAKGGAVGDTALMEAAFPPIKSSFKYVENIENIRNYDFATGYMKFYVEPSDGLDLFVQLGREKLKYGYSYSDRLALSGNAPNMDFLKFNLNYGIVHFSSIFASTVGEYHKNPADNYSKYFIANRLMLSFEKLFDIGIAESIISSRAFDIAYLNPVIFYKFVEMSLQDRDNGTISFDLQTHFAKNLELQGTFFLDENILGNLTDMSKASNKSAYQLGGFWYEPAGIKNLSLILEYTKIRPYVYSHYNPKNTYTAFGEIMGNPIGPNADMIFSKASFNLNQRVRLNLQYRHIRRGENIYDANGMLEKNVGGDVYITHRTGIDPDEAYFLDGIRINTDEVTFNISYEPIRNYIFDLNYVYNMDNNLTNGTKNDFSYAFARFSLGY